MHTIKNTKILNKNLQNFLTSTDRWNIKENVKNNNKKILKQGILEQKIFDICIFF